MRLIVAILLLAGSFAFGQHAGRGSGARGGYGRAYRGGGAIVVPYPAYGGGGYYSGYVAPPASYGYGYDPSYGSYQPGPGYYGDPSQQSPVVIVNPNYRPDSVNPVLRDYSNTLLPAGPDAPATIYLIAMRDHTIFATLAYWVDGDTLNYITSEGVHNRASLALVDRDFSKQLNDERHIEFKLPPEK
jgi:hypothetical protein